MLASIYFYQMPGSLAMGEYPVIANADVVLTEYLKRSYSNYKVTKDFQQRIRVPEFDAWTSVNMVKLTSGSWEAWYWITDRSQSSISNGAIEFALEYAPVTSLLKSGDTLKGYWKRTPINMCRWLQQGVMSGTYRPSDLIKLLGETHNFGTTDYPRVRSMMTVCVTTSDNPETETAEGDGLSLWCFPIAVSFDSDGKLTSEKLSYTVASEPYSYPTVEEFIQRPGKFGFVASAIQNIQVVEGIPFEHTYDLSGEISFTGVRVASSLGTSGAYCALDVSEPRSLWVDKTLPITPKIAETGNISVRDTDGATLMSIPPSWLTYYNGEYYWNYSVRTFLGIGKAYNVLVTNNMMVTIPSKQLPFVGTQWETYQAYAQAFDRESMNYVISNARDILEVQTQSQVINTGVSAVGSLMKGDIGGAVSGIAGTTGQVMTNYRLQNLRDEQTRFQQSLTERRIQAQPCVAYNLGDGINAVLSPLNNPAYIVISEIPGLTDEVYGKFTGRYGYPAEGYQEIPVSSGFYQCTLESTATISGGEYDRLNEELNKGIYIRVIE